MAEAIEKKCTYPDCERIYSGRGYCAGHLLQIREGRQLAPLRRISSAKMTLSERLVEKSRELSCGCIEWTGTMHNGGYGQLSFRGTRYLAHRAAIIANGQEIPDGMEVNHLCGLRRCINPDHLEVVTPAQNAEFKTCAPSGETGIRGVKLTAEGRFQARAVYRKRSYCFGTYSTLEEAEQAVIEGRDALGIHSPEAPCDHSDEIYPRPSRAREGRCSPTFSCRSCL